MTHQWPELVSRLIAGEHLSRVQSSWAMEQVMTGQASPVQLTSFLVALRAKGETVEEVAGLVETMLRHAVRIEVPGTCVDVVGTGGDRSRTVNISTMAAVVVAGTGRRVVKHGNRAASSASGAADVLEALGVRLDLPPERVAELVEEVGITFCFAQAFHPALRYAAATRRELGVPTVFNVLGPLANPAQPAAMAVGVADRRMAPIMAGVLADRGVSALVFRGEDGLDEVSTLAPSRIWAVRAGAVQESVLDATDLGLPRAEAGSLTGGDPAHNAQVVRSVLAGDKGPVRDAVLLNAAAALVAVDMVGAPQVADDAPSTGTTPSPDLAAGSLLAQLAAALEEARHSVDSGRAAEVLDRWVAASGS